MTKEELLELLALLTNYRKAYQGSATVTNEIKCAEEMIDYLLKQLYAH